MSIVGIIGRYFINFMVLVLVEEGKDTVNFPLIGGELKKIAYQDFFTIWLVEWEADGRGLDDSFNI